MARDAQQMHESQRLINHVALVLDGSSSMYSHEKKLISVVDAAVRHLALRSEELKQETRISVYVFADYVKCLIFDMDVMRLPSIADLYRVNGMTALRDGLMQAQNDLATTSQIYGDHAFLTYVATDGQENASRRHSLGDVFTYMRSLLPNWSVGWLVPDRAGVAAVARMGVDSGSISIWDANAADGVVGLGRTIQAATETFMTNRASGVRGTRSVFSTGADAVNDQTVKATLTPLAADAYRLVPVGAEDSRMDDFVRGLGLQYVVGRSYYEFTKTENIQGQKEIVVVDRKTDHAYAGPARDLIGLTSVNERRRPDQNPGYAIFVQSTAPSRKVLRGTRVFIRL